MKCSAQKRSLGSVSRRPVRHVVLAGSTIAARAIAIAFQLSILALSGRSSADVVMSPPDAHDACPRGWRTEGTARGHRLTCVPIECVRSEHCPEGTSCRRVCMCLSDVRRLPQPRARPLLRWVPMFEGACTPAQPCDEEAGLLSICAAGEDGEPVIERPASFEQLPRTPVRPRHPRPVQGCGVMSAPSSTVWFSFGAACLLLLMRRRFT